MEDLLAQLKIKVNELIYLKDPDSTELGKRIVSESIGLIDEIGFESFTFKKLGDRIGSPESTVYRYFENKHKLLIYLTSWYWAWLEYRLVFATINVQSAEERLERAIEVITEPVEKDSNFSHVNEVTLNRIVISESSKAYLTKEVDQENKNGFFGVFMRLVERISQMILVINPDFEYSHTLISTVIEGAHQQKYFVEHLPSLTDCKKSNQQISGFFKEMVFAMIQQKRE